MKSFFKAIGLYDELTFETTLTRSEFVKILNKKIYNSSFSIFDIAEYSIPGRYEYRGYANEDGFLLRRRRHFFDSNTPNPDIKGKFCSESEKTIIKMEIMPAEHFVFSYLLVPLLFSIYFSSIFYILGIIAVLISIYHYFVLRRNIRRGKYDFERELNFIVNNYSVSNF